MSDNVIAFVKDRARGPCGCQYNMGKLDIGYDQVTGDMIAHAERGPRTHYCLRCQAQAALDADGIEYEKDDGRNWGQFIIDYPSSKFNIDAVPAIPLDGTLTFIAGKHTK